MYGELAIGNRCIGAHTDAAPTQKQKQCELIEPISLKQQAQGHLLHGVQITQLEYTPTAQTVYKLALNVSLKAAGA